MNINDYLDETEFATRKIFEAIWHDYDRIEELIAEIEIEKQVVQIDYNRAVDIQRFAEDPDDVMLGVGMYWENYFGADKAVNNKGQHLIKLQEALYTKQFSISLLAGNILEHAKKGLSFSYGHPKNWPSGKTIGSQSLSTVIKEARNQSIHIDEAIRDGQFKFKSVENCFEKLAEEINPTYNDYLKRDLAFEIIKDLGWLNYDAYRADIEALV